MSRYLQHALYLLVINYYNYNILREYSRKQYNNISRFLLKFSL